MHAVNFWGGRGSEHLTGGSLLVLVKERWGEGKRHQPSDKYWCPNHCLIWACKDKIQNLTAWIISSLMRHLTGYQSEKRMTILLQNIAQLNVAICKISDITIMQVCLQLGIFNSLMLSKWFKTVTNRLGFLDY